MTDENIHGSLHDKNSMSKSLAATISLIKWKLISTCFVRAWKTGLEDKYVAPISSHQRMRGLDIEITSSYNKIFNPDNSVVFASTLYSAPILDPATVA
jgi:calcineurin-like phosphoesterase family protein